MKFFKNILTGILILSLSLKLPQMHYNYIRNNTGSKVVTITNAKGTSGGTGFHINARSGKTYILTNSHVCSHIEVDGMVLVHDTEGNSLPRRVLLNSDFTDLCVVEAMPGASGLSLGSAPKAGDIVAVVGHPKLMPITMTRGEIIGEEELLVLDHIIEDEESDKCDAPKNVIQDVQIFIFTFKGCLVKINAYMSNVTILPGSSGSPVVNFFGNVVGVAFAGDDSSNWGSFVTFPDIQKVLKSF